MTWQAYLTWRADVARGTTGGCDVALRPRGRAADGPRVADTCARGRHVCAIYTFNIGYRYKPILRTG